MAKISIQERSEKLLQELKLLIGENEQIERAFCIDNDFIIFTSSRLIVESLKGVIKKGRELFSVPYKNVSYWSFNLKNEINTSGSLTIKFLDVNKPISWRFVSGEAYVDLQKLFGKFCCFGDTKL